VIVVLIDQERGHIDELSLQAVALGRHLAVDAASLTGLVIGGPTDVSAQLVELLGDHGVSTLLFAAHDQLADYAPQAWARAAADAITKTDPAVVLATGTPRGAEVMAHLGAITDLPLAADCLEISVDDPRDVLRARWGGSLLEKARVNAGTVLATVVPHAIAATSVGGPPAMVETFTPQLQPADLLVRATREADVASSSVTLTDARVVVSGGRGVGGADEFAVLDELAELLGGAVGCSRVVTSAGWRPHTDQVGQTGSKVAPDLYIACGISGATQHLAGCRSSKNILVINNDPEAPILAHADYAVIGDLHSILPAIVAETRKVRG
jgi:electron transfer flavoprotein alpha subunit